MQMETPYKLARLSPASTYVRLDARLSPVDLRVPEAGRAAARASVGGHVQIDVSA